MDTNVLNRNWRDIRIGTRVLSHKFVEEFSDGHGFAEQHPGAEAHLIFCGVYGTTESRALTREQELCLANFRLRTLELHKNYRTSGSRRKATSD
jgi:hypothetical protein